LRFILSQVCDLYVFFLLAELHCTIVQLQVKFVEQQITLERVKRSHEVIHDKQLEFPIKRIEDNGMYFRNLDKYDNRDLDVPIFNDKYFTDQWSLVSDNTCNITNNNRLLLLLLNIHSSQTLLERKYF